MQESKKMQESVEEKNKPMSRQQRRALEREVNKKSVQRKTIDSVAMTVKEMVERGKANAICYVAKDGDYSGGILGDVVEVAEAMVKAGKKNKSVFVILKAVSDELSRHYDLIDKDTAKIAGEEKKEAKKPTKKRTTKPKTE